MSRAALSGCKKPAASSQRLTPACLAVLSCEVSTKKEAFKAKEGHLNQLNEKIKGDVGEILTFDFS
jgi:hypothetical protein